MSVLARVCLGLLATALIVGSGSVQPMAGDWNVSGLMSFIAGGLAWEASGVARFIIRGATS